MKLQESLDAILKSSRLGDLRHSKIDNSKYPYVNSLKTQFLLTSFSFAKATDNFMGISRNISLPGLRRQLLVRYGVLVIDNGAFDNKQLRAIQTYMCAIPPHVRIPVAITCFDRLVDRDKNKEITVHNFRCRGAFNVFGLKVGASLENQFPEDYKSVETDIFTIVVAHEYNHNVDSIYVKETKVLEAFKDGLIKKAGHNKQNYLRSMCGDGFFEKSPQEFIASLANQYFCSSLDTLSYALKKAEEGNLNHINQFILMASIYSDETKTYFYSIDKQGRTKVTGHPAKRKDGLITALSVRTKTYRFIYAGGVINEVVGL